MKPVHRVLVVEDDREIRESIGTLLTDAGYEVQTSANGLEALRAARSSPPDVIVLDLNVPLMNGWEFRQAQRSDPRLARIPVVAVSARPPSEEDEMDVTVRVAKPGELHELLSAFRVLENATVLVPLRGGREELGRPSCT